MNREEELRFIPACLLSMFLKALSKARRERKSGSNGTPTTPTFWLTTQYCFPSTLATSRLLTVTKSNGLCKADCSNRTIPNFLIWFWDRSQLEQHVGLANKVALYHVPMYPSSREYDAHNSALLRTHWLPLFDWYWPRRKKYKTSNYFSALSSTQVSFDCGVWESWPHLQTHSSTSCGQPSPQWDGLSWYETWPAANKTNNKKTKLGGDGGRWRLHGGTSKGAYKADLPGEHQRHTVLPLRWTVLWNCVNVM